MLESKTVPLGDICSARIFQGENFNPQDISGKSFNIKCGSNYKTMKQLEAIYFDTDK